MASRKRNVSNAVKIDLTPMIDVVFQLIIFFILTMTFTNPDYRAVQLPTALTAVEEDRKEIYTMHLYHAQGGKADVIPPTEGWHVTLPRSNDQYFEVGQLAPKLIEQASLQGKNEQGNSEMEVLVRGDMRCPSHYFSVILAACQQAKIYKIRVSVQPKAEVLRNS